MTGGDPSLSYLLARLGVIEARVRVTVATRRAEDPSAEDPFRGLYLSDEQVDRLLAGAAPPPPPDQETARFLAAIEAEADAGEAAGADLRLRRLARSFGLEPLDVELLLVAMAPDLDSRFERLYGYLHDDVTRRRASIGLALELAGLPPAAGRARQRLTPSGPLVAAGLITVDEPDRPFLTRSLQVPDRVTGHLLGDDHDDSDLLHLLAEARSDAAPDSSGLARALRAGARLCYLRERPGSSGRSLAAAALAAAGRPIVAIDLGRLGTAEDPGVVARTAMRDARLRGAGLVAGPVEALSERGYAAVRAFADPAAPWSGADPELAAPVLLIGRRSWEPAWSHDVPVLVDVEPPTSGDRAALWRATLNGQGDGVDAGEVTQHFRLTPEQVGRAARAARLQAVAAGSQLGLDHLRAGARAQNAAGLENLAKRIVPKVGWPDLVLPAGTMAGLQELAARARHRDLVIDEWGMRPGGGRGRGITGLFAGDSGTGKTMSAEVIAGELGLDLYAINLATVVDKYVGETEKNLERIFSEADGINGVLLFDEADAIFGKRSEVRDAHDRYANIEVAYLLQRMESFDGLAILSTNLRANLDDAFARRLDAVIDFPVPDTTFRRMIWERCLGKDMPLAPDIDLDFAASRFELSGGNIRSIAVTAAYFAAETGREVTMLDLMRATQREYRKLGRMCVESEFGPWYSLVFS
ncbi:MAG: ATP-binding protein [Actinobacteria bacterium]|nr:ATP-binding protein [Actinomycetota bacterium]MBW3649193.1 ATP-binding protein [Actinomycetota bacterium]